MARLTQHRPGNTQAKSTTHIDRIRESQIQSSIFRNKEGRKVLDFAQLQAILQKEPRIPEPIANEVLLHIQDNLDSLGLVQPNPNLVFHWLTGLLQERGYTLDESSLQLLELSLGDVELNINHPVGLGAGANQNPEATSQKIAQRIKAQFAEKRVFQEEVIEAHDAGHIDLMHLGAIDRPHDVFLTPEYLKIAGLPVTGSAPAAGPAKRAHVLLAHMIRFTHELQNHFAGDIQWGYVNTLMLPYLAGMSDQALYQFVQQMLFEFGQLDVERGSLYRKVILDFDFDLPRQLAGLPATVAGGEESGKTYGDHRKALRRFNEVALDILAHGDFRGSPFHSPRIVYHFNNPDTTWGKEHQRLMEIAFKFGNPSVAFSHFHRDFGPLGRWALNDSDFLKILQTPGRLRGFSSSSLALNLPDMAFPRDDGDFTVQLESVLDLAVSAHRQKRLFISRLMAYGNRGPLQFLRHKIGGTPFLKIDSASQPMHLIGLGEAAALCNRSPLIPPEVLGKEALRILEGVHKALTVRNRIHKLNMFMTGAKSESVAYRFAYLDLRRFGQKYAPYVFRQSTQTHPIYSEGPNILAFTNLPWRDRLHIEGRLHPHFSGHALTFFLKHGVSEDPSLYHKVYQESQEAGISHLLPAPDLLVCMSCFLVFDESEGKEHCPACQSTLISPYGYCQSHFSPIRTWCLGKRSEWKIRRRVDDLKLPVQTRLPW